MDKGMIYAVHGATPMPSWVETWLPPIVTILGVMLTVGVTAWIAFEQMKRQERQNRSNRLIETKREVLLDGVRGMYEAHAAYGQLTNMTIPHGEILMRFQSGMSKVATAGAVASIEAVEAGRKLGEVFGPVFMVKFGKRARLSHQLKQGEADFRELAAFAEEVTAEMEKLNRAQINVLAAIRKDIDIDSGVSMDEFKAAATTDFKLVREAIDAALRELK